MTRVLVPGGCLGLGHDEEALLRGSLAKPDIIAVDGGSTDSGPYYLGAGVSKYSEASIRREWSGLLAARKRADAPLVLGTAGTCGTGRMVDRMRALTQEILAETGERARIATLKSDQSAAALRAALRAGRIAPLPPSGDLAEADIDECENRVALAGAEQVVAALATGADIVIAGRATDTAIIAALPLQRGDSPGAAWHGAKIGECGALCAATLPRSGVLQLDFDEAGFTVTPLAEGARATPKSVSAHMLYENADPFLLHEPGGTLDVREARYVQMDDRSVRVAGSRWNPSATYTVKLEGARRTGYRSVMLTLLRDRRYVQHSTAWCDGVRERLAARAGQELGLEEGDYRLELRQIGRDATLGPWERRIADPVEVGVLGIVTASSQSLADELGRMLNPLFLHHSLSDGEAQPTFAFPISPASMRAEPAYAFALNHVMTLEDPMDAFVLDVCEA